uniref:Autophagy-related protein 29 n=1 Tax=Blastobotrys adeninivorans TaxID=409370 RepID=A0A060TG02_BLAAD
MPEGQRVTVYLRFPFSRNGFQDPPEAHWDKQKEKSLWEYLSASNNRADINWTQLARQFQVSTPFILQQAAWLYERELEQVRAQMQKVKVHDGAEGYKNSGDKLKEPTEPVESPGPEAATGAGTGTGSSSFESVQPYLSRRAGSREASPQIHSSPSSNNSFYEGTQRPLLSQSRFVDQDEEEYEPAFAPTVERPKIASKEDKQSESSFTDLSETSVSKSALEEAILREMDRQ